MYQVDLHIHTSESDGLLTPQQTVDWAVKKRLKAIAITDHDTTNGIHQAIEHAGNNQLFIVPGIELNTYTKKQEVHILGYFINYKSKNLQLELEKLKRARQTRAEKILKKLAEINHINITMDDVKEYSKHAPVGRPHIARALVHNKLAPDMNYVFKNLLGINCPAYVRRYKLTPADAVKLINQNDGVSVLAHPGLLQYPQEIQQILDTGIRGIEVYHTLHDDEQRKKFLQIAEARKLLVTGGSDSHGDIFGSMPIIGNTGINWDMFISFRKAANA